MGNLVYLELNISGSAADAIIRSKPNNLSDLKGIFMKTKTKLIIYLSILAILDMIIPIPFTTLMLIYVLFEKPAWFKNLVTDIYTS